jgi:hypothetical protein
MAEKMTAFLAGEGESCFAGERAPPRPSIADCEEVNRSCVGGNAHFLRAKLTMELPAESSDEDEAGMVEEEAEVEEEEVEDKGDEGDEEEEEEEEEEKGGKGTEEDDENGKSGGEVGEEVD